MRAAPPDTILRFEWSVRALAQSAGTQFTLFPPFVCVADELALEFEEQYGRVREQNVSLGRGEVAVRDLDKKLEEMSGPQHEELWTDDALRQEPDWEEIRVLARRVIDVMGWSDTPPPSERAEYVGADA